MKNLARYSLIMKDTIYSALVQHGANLEPTKTLGRLINDILNQYAENIPEYFEVLPKTCMYCLFNGQGICVNKKSLNWNKNIFIKKGCVVFERRKQK